LLLWEKRFLRRLRYLPTVVFVDKRSLEKVGYALLAIVQVGVELWTVTIGQCLVISPIEQLAYATVRLQIADFAYKTARMKSDV